MDNIELQSVVSSGTILVDARYLEDFSVGEFLTTFTLKLKKLGVPIKIGLVIPFEHTEDMYQKIILECDEKQFDLSFFFYVHSKYNYSQGSIDALRTIIEKNNNVLFITQNQSTAFDVSKFNTSNFTTYVRRISFNCTLEQYPMILEQKNDDRPLFSYINGISPRIDKIPQGCYVPKLGDKIIINDKEIMLRQTLGLVADGHIYIIDEELVVKIYTHDKLTKTLVDKILTMCKKRINDYSICWPINVVKNKDGFIVGYTMKRCVGKPISTLYRGPIVTLQIYPNFSIKNAINIAIKILEKIQILHKNNILVADINDRNFIINNFEEVYLINTDRYQIEDYSCDVGTIGYISPELKDGILSTTLRSFEDEEYSLAVFVFRTLMFGHFPFAQIGTDNDFVELIKKQQFPYRINSSKTKKSVPTLAVEPWEQLPPLLMKMFTNTFMYDKKTKMQERYSVEQWIIALENYLDVLSERE